MNFGTVAQLRLVFAADGARPISTPASVAGVRPHDRYGAPAAGLGRYARLVGHADERVVLQRALRRFEDWLNGEEDYALVETVYANRLPSERQFLSLIVGGAESRGELPVSQEIELGGIRTFPGLRPGELRGDEYWFAGTAY